MTHEQLKDKNTANFIYDFVEKHGGIEEANRQLEEASRHQSPPPPPRRDLKPQEPSPRRDLKPQEPSSPPVSAKPLMKEQPGENTSPPVSGDQDQLLDTPHHSSGEYQGITVN